MFDLEKAINEWREVSAEHVPEEDLDELEAHLRDGVEARIEAGEKPEEALILMIHQIGDPKKIGKELTRESGKLPPAVNPGPRRRSPVIGLLVGFSIAVVALFAVEFFAAYQNQQFLSRARFELRQMRDAEDLQVFGSVRTPEGERGVDVETELRILLGGEVIDLVVKKLRLDVRWDVVSSQARKRVRSNVLARRLGDSRVIELVYRDQDPSLSAEIAREWVVQYGDYKNRLWESRHQDALNMLSDQIKHHTDRVEEGRLRMLDLAERYRITPSLSKQKGEGELRAFEAYAAARLEMFEVGGDSEVLAEKEARMRTLLEEARDRSLDYLRMSAEYEDARSQYEMDRDMLREMQRAFARSRVLLEMPTRPLEIHTEPEVAVRPLPMPWLMIWSGVGTKGWPVMIVLSALGWFLGGRRGRGKSSSSSFFTSPFPVRVTKGGKKDADEEISWA